MRGLRNFFRHSGGDRLLLLIALILLGAIRLGLWLLPFRKLLKLLHKISKPDLRMPNPKSSKVSVDKIVWAINVASRYMPGGVKCLARALTASVLMNHQGLLPEICIGVAKGEGGELEAHAWVKYQGQVVIGNLTDLGRFIPLPSLEGVKL